jgi:hypothetical protein
VVLAIPFVITADGSEACSVHYTHAAINPRHALAMSLPEPRLMLMLGELQQAAISQGGEKVRNSWQAFRPTCQSLSMEITSVNFELYIIKLRHSTRSLDLGCSW